ncbi:hypothetical protein [Variovorax boronicumulans]|uniref:hypothetical protein n=1 Tax=Variovorax boronicumulans TaxID=436515 RepID=UPI000AF0DE04|nr:hypothetical protein [Variovorax boronicumulans]
MFFEPYVHGSPKCYAHKLGGCSSGISGEHVFTKAVMGEGSIAVVGWPKIPDHTFIGLGSATANVLCVDHNSALSGLDSEAKKLSDALGEFHSAKAGETQVALDGSVFERWLLKVTLGHLAAGMTAVGKRYPLKAEVVAALFGLIPMAAPIGMYSMAGVERNSSFTKEFLFRELTAVDPMGQPRVIGAFIALHGLPFLFYLGGPFPIDGYFLRPDGTSYLDPYDCQNAKANFHPPSLFLRDEGAKSLRVDLAWPDVAPAG